MSFSNVNLESLSSAEAVQFLINHREEIQTIVRSAKGDTLSEKAVDLLMETGLYQGSVLQKQSKELASRIMTQAGDAVVGEELDEKINAFFVELYQGAMDRGMETAGKMIPESITKRVPDDVRDLVGALIKKRVQEKGECLIGDSCTKVKKVVGDIVVEEVLAGEKQEPMRPLGDALARTTLLLPMKWLASKVSALFNNLFSGNKGGICLSKGAMDKAESAVRIGRQLWVAVQTPLGERIADRMEKEVTTAVVDLSKRYLSAELMNDEQRQLLAKKLVEHIKPQLMDLAKGSEKSENNKSIDLN